MRLWVPLVLIALPAAATATAATPGTPPRYVLLVDVSGSMAQGQRMPALAGSLAATLAILPDGSEVGLVAFHHQPWVVAPPTRLDAESRARLLAQVEALTPGGGTDLLAATRLGLDQFGGKGGHLILFSDGSHTATGNVPLPEPVWGPGARELVARARGAGVVVQAIGFDDQPEGRALLGRLAAGTGGEFTGVSRPEAMIGEFVGLAARLAGHWRLATPAEFSVTRPEVVIQVTAAAAPPCLFRNFDDGRVLPVAPTFQAEKGGVRVERLALEPGRYAFRPAPGGARSDLLRPLDVAFTLPDVVTLPAHRVATLVVPVRPLVSGQALPASLRLVGSFRFEGAEAQTVAAVVGSDGTARLSVVTPARTGPFTVALRAESGGWVYAIGTVPGMLVNPPPLEYTVAVDPAPATIETRGAKLERASATLALRLVGPEGGPEATLALASDHPKVTVDPSAIHLAPGAREARAALSLTRPVGMAEPAVLETALVARLQVNDLVPPKLNGGGAEARIPVRWTHRRPGLRLDGVTSEGSNRVTITRGSARSWPMRLEGVDLAPGQVGGVNLEPVQAVPGVTLAFRTRSGDSSGLTTTDGPASLVLSVGRDVTPGRYTVEARIRSTFADVPLNDRSEPLDLRFEVDVSPVQVVVEPVDAATDLWEVLAPIEAATRRVAIVLRPTDNGPLPPGVRLEANAEGLPMTLKDLGGGFTESNARWVHDFEATIPAQCPPFDGLVRFRVAPHPAIAGGSRVVEWPVRVPEVVVKVATVPREIRVPTYGGLLERCFGWTRRDEPVGMRLDVSGPWAKAGCSWAIGTARGELLWHTSPTEVVQVDPHAGPFLLRLRSLYRHTRFEPSGGWPLPGPPQPTPLPWWIAVGSIGAGSGSILLIVVIVRRVVRAGRVQVVSDDRQTHRGFLRLSLGSAGVSLSRARGGVRASRTRGESGAISVVVRSARFGDQELVPGQSRPLVPGDRIELSERDSGSSHGFVLLDDTGAEPVRDEWDDFGGEAPRVGSDNQELAPDDYSAWDGRP